MFWKQVWGAGQSRKKIAESDAVYTGIDIAPNPVQLVRERLKLNNLEGKVHEGSILSAPFEDNSFDFVIAIGCYHHTGNLQKAIDETYRVLKNGGTAIIMLYYAYSYRQWLANTKQTFKLLFNEVILRNSIYPQNASNKIRHLYDFTTTGETAPETVLTSRLQFRELAKEFKTIDIHGENIEEKYFFKYFGRNRAGEIFGNLLGLDIYCTCIK